MIHDQIHPAKRLRLRPRDTSELDLYTHELHPPCVSALEKAVPVFKGTIARINVLIIRAVVIKASSTLTKR
jgi:hypothetical protein